MKLAIISDVHIGRRQYRTDENNYNKYEQIGYKVLKQTVDEIKKQQPDLIINSGDIFDTPNPSVLAMTNYFNAQKQFKPIPTMTILGNHDFAFNNKKNQCSAVEMAHHTYFADYEIKEVEIDGILFVMMPYIYDTASNILSYLHRCKCILKSSKCTKKILVTHGVTEKYYKDSFISDPIMLTNGLVELCDLVIIGHIHTPFSYKQKNTIVISPGAMIDYQAYSDVTGPVFFDTDTMEFERVLIKTPHIVKVKCNEKNINKCLKDVEENIYHITYEGNTELIDNDLFISAKAKSVNLTIDVVQNINVTEEESRTLSLDVYEWVATNYPDYTEIFKTAKEALSINGNH